jgi:hypothetical protein
VYPHDVPGLTHAYGVAARVEGALTDLQAAVAAASSGAPTLAAAGAHCGLRAAVHAELAALAGDLAAGVGQVDAVVRGVHRVGDDVALVMRALLADGAE